MTKGTQCSFPGCDCDVKAWGRCWGHRPMKEVRDYCDVYCQICGFGPRVTLAGHVNRFHEGTADYKRRFGSDSLSSESFRLNFRAIWDDRVEDGVLSVSGRQTKCKRGHRLTASNSYVRVRRGYVMRTCRQCSLDRARRHKVKLRARKCQWCGRRFQPIRKNHIFCTEMCGRQSYNLSTSKRYRERKCVECGETYAPRTSYQKYCSKPCHWKAANRRQYQKRAKSPAPQ